MGKHEVVDQQLRASVEQFPERFRAVVGLEGITPLDGHLRQFPALACQLVTAAGELFLAIEQLDAGGKPLLTRSDRMHRHRIISIVLVDLHENRLTGNSSSRGRLPDSSNPEV
jgi:hypothetical protein